MTSWDSIPSHLRKFWIHFEQNNPLPRGEEAVTQFVRSINQNIVPADATKQVKRKTLGAVTQSLGFVHSSKAPLVRDMLQFLTEVVHQRNVMSTEEVEEDGGEECGEEDGGEESDEDSALGGADGDLVAPLTRGDIDQLAQGDERSGGDGGSDNGSDSESDESRVNDDGLRNLWVEDEEGDDEIDMPLDANRSVGDNQTEGKAQAKERSRNGIDLWTPLPFDSAVLSATSRKDVSKALVANLEDRLVFDRYNDKDTAKLLAERFADEQLEDLPLITLKTLYAATYVAHSYALITACNTSPDQPSHASQLPYSAYLKAVPFDEQILDTIIGATGTRFSSVAGSRAQLAKDASTDIDSAISDFLTSAAVVQHLSPESSSDVLDSAPDYLVFVHAGQTRQSVSDRLAKDVGMAGRQTKNSHWHGVLSESEKREGGEGKIVRIFDASKGGKYMGMEGRIRLDVAETFIASLVSHPRTSTNVAPTWSTGPMYTLSADKLLASEPELVAELKNQRRSTDSNAPQLLVMTAPGVNHAPGTILAVELGQVLSQVAQSVNPATRILDIFNSDTETGGVFTTPLVTGETPILIVDSTVKPKVYGVPYETSIEECDEYLFQQVINSTPSSSPFLTVSVFSDLPIATIHSNSGTTLTKSEYRKQLRVFGDAFVYDATVLFFPPILDIAGSYSHNPTLRFTAQQAIAGNLLVRNGLRAILQRIVLKEMGDLKDFAGFQERVLMLAKEVLSAFANPTFRPIWADPARKLARDFTVLFYGALHTVEELKLAFEESNIIVDKETLRIAQWIRYYPHQSIDKWCQAHVRNGNTLFRRKRQINVICSLDEEVMLSPHTFHDGPRSVSGGTIFVYRWEKAEENRSRLILLPLGQNDRTIDKRKAVKPRPRTMVSYFRESKPGHSSARFGVDLLGRPIVIVLSEGSPDLEVDISRDIDYSAFNLLLPTGHTPLVSKVTDRSNWSAQDTAVASAYQRSGKSCRTGHGLVGIFAKLGVTGRTERQIVRKLSYVNTPPPQRQPRKKNVKESRPIEASEDDSDNQSTTSYNDSRNYEFTRPSLGRVAKTQQSYYNSADDEDDDGDGAKEKITEPQAARPNLNKSISRPDFTKSPGSPSRQSAHNLNQPLFTSTASHPLASGSNHLVESGIFAGGVRREFEYAENGGGWSGEFDQEVRGFESAPPAAATMSRSFSQFSSARPHSHPSSDSGLFTPMPFDNTTAAHVVKKPKKHTFDLIVFTKPEGSKKAKRSHRPLAGEIPGTPAAFDTSQAKSRSSHQPTRRQVNLPPSSINSTGTISSSNHLMERAHQCLEDESDDELLLK